MTSLRIGTRGSELALFQANAVARRLDAQGDTHCEIVVIKTSGDRLAEAPLSDVGGKRLFVKEIEDALLAGTVDLAVHSSKDMPAVLPEGLEVGAVLPREDPLDAVVFPAAASTTGENASLEEIVRRMGRAPRVGTSSVRRIAQLTRVFANAQFLPIRGNLGTRLRKLDAGEFDAIVLAAAGLRRLDKADRIAGTLPVDACVPAPGQGIIAIEVRAGRADITSLVQAIDDDDAATALRAERAVVARLGGGCQMPIGAYAEVVGDHVTLTAVVVSTDGARAVRATASGARALASEVGVQAAERLIAEGAADILGELRDAEARVEGIQP